MMVIRFSCEYNGKDFKGFQRQKDLRTVQAVLEEALAKYFCQQIKIVASGRTDAGVHARGQVCSFRLLSACDDLYKACGAINAFLPADVAVRDFKAVDDKFHAQFDAKKKTYSYRCFTSPHRSPLREDRYLQLYKQPDVAAMQAAAETLLGTHNFKTFASEHTDKTDFVRTLHSFTVTQNDDEIIFVVSGNGFLRNMVRIMIGTLLDVGAGNMSLQEFVVAHGGQNRKLAGFTAPAHALTLENVEY